MGFVSLGRWRARSQERAAQSARLKSALSAILGLGPEDALAISEIACADPGCPDVETVVLVMRRDEPTRALKLAVGMPAIGPQEIEALAEQDRRDRATPR